ncbi:amidohydrolase family protein [Streptomyces radicis]|uniref:Amidohydrolase family protein n=1 Tax=Streptomyces radicis TaxID=1750517 RepID=A0A3A9W2P7_9ACTN|nr:amidohydrolase family protein [Streptomyces radicis]RKN07022.1 amidohydrolase family protein [Streptomyces radicis]RKN15083.1 amidohydrolase family protein [Streptomyces radicis]
MHRLLLAGGSVLDVRTGKVAPADVVVEGDRIADVGGTGLDGDDAVDCAGRLLIPGLIDCHTHVALTRTPNDPLGLPRSARALSIVPVLRTLLRLGVTTVRDAWGADAGMRLAVERGWIEGPEILISLRQVCTTGGLGDHWRARSGPLDFFGDPSMPDPVFDGEDGARAVVRRMVRADADWIKVTATGSLVLGRGVHDVQLTDGELAALVDEADRQGGRGVMVHAHGARAAEAAARAGARSVEHGTYLDERAVAAMAEAGTWLVPTLSTTQSAPDEAPDGAPEAHRASVRLALDAGVTFAMGTDNPVRPHGEALREIAHLAEAGLGAAGALRAATLDAARLLERADDRGEIAEGKRADLVLLDGKDLDVTALDTRVHAVWHRGRRVA